jgi:hypothetical protein
LKKENEYGLIFRMIANCTDYRSGTSQPPVVVTKIRLILADVETKVLQLNDIVRVISNN